MAAHNWLSISLLAPMFHIPPTYMYMYVKLAHCHYGKHLGNPVASNFGVITLPISIYEGEGRRAQNW